MRSLIADDQQLPLTTADMGPDRFDALEREGEYTGERLFRHRRADYDLIVRMLGEGMSCVSISRIMQCAEKTVAAVRQRELAHLPTPDVKTAMGARWAQTFHMAADIMQEIAEDKTRRSEVTFKDAAIAASIATQNQQLLAGEATGRVEHVVPTTSDHNDLEDYLARLRKVRVVDVVSESTTNPTTEPDKHPQVIAAVNVSADRNLGS